MSKEIFISRIMLFFGIGRLLSVSFIQPIYVCFYMHYKKLFAKSDFEVIKKIIHDGTSAIDVGANLGLYTAYFSKCTPSGRVLAIEPESKNLYYLKKLSIRCKNIILFKGAVGDINGKAYLNVNKNHPGDHHLSEQGIPVVIKKLDTLISEQKIDKISLIKIDVQGAELQVLEGCVKIIKAKPTFFIEVDSKSLERFGICHHDIFDFFEQYAYKPFISCKGGLKSYDPQTFTGFQDLFFMSKT